MTTLHRPRLSGHLRERLIALAALFALASVTLGAQIVPPRPIPLPPLTQTLWPRAAGRPPRPSRRGCRRPPRRARARHPGRRLRQRRPPRRDPARPHGRRRPLRSRLPLDQQGTQRSSRMRRRLQRPAECTNSTITIPTGIRTTRTATCIRCNRSPSRWRRRSSGWPSIIRKRRASIGHPRLLQGSRSLARGSASAQSDAVRPPDDEEWNRVARKRSSARSDEYDLSARGEPRLDRVHARAANGRRSRNEVGVQQRREPPSWPGSCKLQRSAR